MKADNQLAKRAREQADRLRAQLAEQASLPVDQRAAAQQIAAHAADLQTALAALPGEAAAGLMTAELGFMPGAAADAALPGHRADWDSRLKRLAQGARALESWLDAEGEAAYRSFLIRGYIRGFAHAWREACDAPADPTPGSDFFRFAVQWLEHAGVHDDPAPLLAAALSSDWRVGGG